MASAIHHSPSQYLEGILSDKQLRRLERKAKRQIKTTGKNQSLSPSLSKNIVDIDTARKKKHVQPQTPKQDELIRSILTSDQTITYGSAGTGKTYVTAALAANMLASGRFDKIILTRPNVPTGRSIGFFPGTLEEKMEPWVAPVTNVIKEVLGEAVYELALKRKDIEIVPFEVIRGYSFEDSFVILDEAQNATLHELKAFMTRVGSDSKVVINGDISQTDIGSNSGLGQIVEMARTSPHLRGKVKIVPFDSNDVVRSDICADWVKSFEMLG